MLLAAWFLLVAWLYSGHVFWRDEIRAFSLALSGSNLREMLGAVHGEGHPALWYLILRGAHELFPYREVLPIAGAVIGIAAMVLFTLYSPFRLVIVALALFSAFGAFEYVVVARNYGMSALVMFALAALYGRVKNGLWFGAILLLLCNTNVPSCLLAAGFLLFRFVEMLTSGAKPTRREWLVFAGNALLAAAGAVLAFITVYPTFNDAAVSSHSAELNPAGLIAALLDQGSGFSNMGPLGAIFAAIACLAFIRRPAALCAAVAGFLSLKLFFYFVYLSYYRHEALFVVFLLSLAWITAKGAGGAWRQKPWMQYIHLVGTLAFVVLLALQFVRLLVVPVNAEVRGIPFSRSAEVAQLLRTPPLAGAIVMGDPDTMLEPLPYYVDNPLWFLRQQRFGNVVRLSNKSRRQLTPDDFLADARRLHQATGRPIVLLIQPRLRRDHGLREMVLFKDGTVGTAESVNRFLASTRLIARLRPSEGSDENYEVYVYPR